LSGSAPGVVSDDQASLLPPLQTLDGFGRLGAPSTDAVSIAARDFDKTAKPGPATSAGLLRPRRRAAGRSTSPAAVHFPAADGRTSLAGVERAGFVSAPCRRFQALAAAGGTVPRA
jgi:hypothetical protein